MLTQERLKEVLQYDEDTGIFTWKKMLGTKRIVGDIAGSVYSNGYRVISIDNHRYRAHRLAWFYVYNDFPTVIDHINRIKDDNRIKNLRSVSFSENMQNVFNATSRNLSGYRGVSTRVDCGRTTYHAQIQKGNKIIYIGTFKTAIEASEAYLNEKRNLHAVAF